MRCEEIRESCSDYLRETLDAHTGAAVREHLDACAECRSEFLAVRALWASLGEVSVPDVDGNESKAAVMAAVQWRIKVKAATQALVVIVVLGGLAAGAGLLLKPERQPAAARVDTVSHIRGPQDAPLTLIEYGDYECPPCIVYRYHDMVERLLEKYPETIRYEFRHFPLRKIHPNALPAAMAAEAAGAQGKFWEMHRALLGSYDRWSRNPNPQGVFLDLASRLDLDLQRFSQTLASTETEQDVLRQAEFGREAGIEGTPTFVLNGMKLGQAPRTFEDFDSIIVEALRNLKLQRAKSGAGPSSNTP